MTENITKVILSQIYQIKQQPQIMDVQLRQRLLQLQQACQILSSAGKYSECIEVMQQIVAIKKQVYGLGHQEFHRATQKLCEYLNLAAMIYLQKEKFDHCLDYLRKAQLVSRNSLPLKATTYNNLACYYRRNGKIRTALTYLIQALELQLKQQHPKSLPDTHLNLCAVLSQLDRHQDALQHSMLSIILLQDEFLNKLLDQKRKGVLSRYQQNKQAAPIDEERLAVLAIAYHNMGVEFQHLKRFQQAVKIYKKALTLSQTHLPDNLPLISNLNKVVLSATQQIEEKKRNTSQQKKQIIERQFSQTKNNIYKDFARNSQRLNKNLPKLKFNKEMFELKQKYEPSSNPQQRYDSRQKEESIIDKASRSFASRKHPRYYKSYGVSNNLQPRNLISQQTSQRTYDEIILAPQQNQRI